VDMTAHLVTAIGARARGIVTNGKAPRFAWATASVASRVGSCPTDCGGRCCGRCPCPTPLSLGSVAFISVKGEGFARSVLALWAALRVRLPVPLLTPIPAMTQLRLQRERGQPPRRRPAIFGDSQTLARSATCHQRLQHLLSFLTTINAT
jgi:hypothetical protein